MRASAASPAGAASPVLGELKLDAISVRFGRVQALDAVTVPARAGEALMLVGPNGAGKSTLVRVLLGLVRPDAGRICLGGQPVKVDRAFKTRLGYLPEAIAFSESLTGAQVLGFFARARNVSRARVKAVLERVGLAHAAKRAVRGYSRGMRQRLGLGIAILADPPLLVLDEPTGGLDQEGLGVLFSVLSEWRDKGRTVVVASHDLTLLERRVDRVCVLKSGRRVALDTPAALRHAAGLPVRVTFTTQGDATPLEAAIVESGETRIERSPGRLVVEVAPDRLLRLMDTREPYGALIGGLRVEEPGMDEIYEYFLQASPESEEPHP